MTHPDSHAPAGAPAAPRHRRRRSLVVAIVAILGGVVLVVGLAAALGPSDSAPDYEANGLLHTVEPGPLTISIVTSGTIKSSQAVVIKSEVEGRTTILSLVEEGTQVTAGDLLIELDASEQENDRVDQETIVQNAEASWVQAREKLGVVKQQAQVDIDAAQVELDRGVLDLEKYTSEDGEYQHEVKRAESKITIAWAKLERAKDRMEWSKKLLDEGFKTRSQANADELEHQEAQIELDLAKGDMRLLERFTFRRKNTELKSAVRQKVFALAKTKHNAASNTVDAEASLNAKGAAFKRAQQRLEKIVDQIQKCRIVAPVDGMVVYATSNEPAWRGVEPLDEGTEVRERQKLIRLPTTQKMQSDVKIHESMLKKVRVGQTARITTDAQAGRVFAGRVAKIAVLPDAQNRWMNPDLKVYNGQIEIVGDASGMRPGYSCRTEIIVEEHENVMFVPIQCVLRVDGEPTVYLPGPNGPQPRQIEIGLDNNTMTHVKSGLQAGDRVLLNPPLPQSTLRNKERPAKRRGKEGRKADKQADDDKKKDEKKVEKILEQLKGIEGLEGLGDLP
jgi:HlyD family secretion protein